MAIKLDGKQYFNLDPRSAMITEVIEVMRWSPNDRSAAGVPESQLYLMLTLKDKIMKKEWLSDPPPRLLESVRRDLKIVNMTGHHRFLSHAR